MELSESAEGGHHRGYYHAGQPRHGPFDGQGRRQGGRQRSRRPMLTAFASQIAMGVKASVQADAYEWGKAYEGAAYFDTWQWFNLSNTYSERSKRQNITYC